MSPSFTELTGVGLAGVLWLLVLGVVVSALILSVSFRLVVGYMPNILRALGAVVSAFIAVVVALVILGMVMPGTGGRLLTLVVNFLVGAAAVNSQLPMRDGDQIGYGKACAVELIYMAISLLLALLIGLIFAMMFGLAVFGIH